MYMYMLTNKQTDTNSQIVYVLMMFTTLTFTFMSTSVNSSIYSIDVKNSGNLNFIL